VVSAVAPPGGSGRRRAREPLIDNEEIDMARTIIVAGYGPGISDAVAKKFGADGFRVALVARSRDKVEAAAKELAAGGVEAKGFACDLGDDAAVAKLVADVRDSLGPITVIHWNAYTGGAGDLTSSDVGELRRVLDVAVHGLVVMVQKALPDLRASKESAVLVTGGGFAFYSEQVDGMAVNFSAMGLAVGKAAQHKLTGLLHLKLKAEGIYVGEVVVLGTVKGTAFDRGQANLDPADIAAKFHELYEGRSVATTNFGG
jgi:short-subunit dehydrogenase